MEVVDAVDLVVEVDGEGNAVEALLAHAAPEAAGVERLAHRLQDLGRRTERRFGGSAAFWIQYKVLLGSRIES